MVIRWMVVNGHMGHRGVRIWVIRRMHGSYMNHRSYIGYTWAIHGSYMGYIHLCFLYAFYFYVGLHIGEIP